MSQPCYACYEEVSDGGLYHSKCAKKVFGTPKAPTLAIKMLDIENLANEFINKRLTIPGVQKKLSLNLDKTKEANDRLTIVGFLGGTHILKPPTDHYPNMPEIENLTMNLAEICEIPTAAHSLIQMEDGAIAYITKRFDRIKKKKVAVEDLCQLSKKLTEQKYKSSSGSLLLQLETASVEWYKCCSLQFNKENIG